MHLTRRQEQETLGLILCCAFLLSWNTGEHDEHDDSNTHIDTVTERSFAKAKSAITETEPSALAAGG